MEVFLLLIILIVMLGALGWLPAVMRILIVLATITIGCIYLVVWLAGREPPKQNSYDAVFKELNDKIYSDTDKKKHDHVRR